MKHPDKDVDMCDFCKKRVATIGAHGIRKEGVYSEDFCAECYAKRNNLSEQHLKRLKSDAEELANEPAQQKAKRERPKQVKKRDVPAPVSPDKKQSRHRDTHVAPPSLAAAPASWTPRLPGA